MTTKPVIQATSSTKTPTFFSDRTRTGLQDFWTAKQGKEKGQDVPNCYCVEQSLPAENKQNGQKKAAVSGIVWHSAGCVQNIQYNLCQFSESKETQPPFRRGRGEFCRVDFLIRSFASKRLPALTFCYFWVKPKVREKREKKNVQWKQSLACHWQDPRHLSQWNKSLFQSLKCFL